VKKIWRKKSDAGRAYDPPRLNQLAGGNRLRHAISDANANIPISNSVAPSGSGVIVRCMNVESIMIGSFPANPISAVPQFPENVTVETNGPAKTPPGQSTA
jgi:hypothetical protein